MRLRVFITCIALIFLSLPSSGTEPPASADSFLLSAAAEMKNRNYHLAAKLADKAAESGERDLLLGMAVLKSGRYDEAVNLLARAARSYPLLADIALNYQAQALLKSGKPVEALPVLTQLQREFPESPTGRNNLLKQGEILFDAGDYAAAEKIYLSFIEKYPAGSDALQALYKSGLCREGMNDAIGAANIFRSLWLNSPSTAQAAKAEEDLKRLALQEVTVAPYSSQELFKMGNNLYEKRKYDSALKIFRSIAVKNEKKDFSDRLEFKIAQTLLKMRRYQDAETALTTLISRDVRRETKAEASRLLARSIEKSGRDEEAFIAYVKVAETFPGSREAENALLDAAFIRKFQKRPVEMVALLGRILEVYPATKLKHRIWWEIAWGSYLSGNYAAANEQLSRLLAVEDYRERAFYWLGRSQVAAGDAVAASEQFALLANEFPHGFYALQIPEKLLKKQDESLPRLSGEALDNFPRPEGYDRVKALISLGLIDDAARELAVSRKKAVKGNGERSLVRFYLEIGDFNAALSLVSQETLKKTPIESRASWSVLYPKAFSDLTSRYARDAGIPASLAFAVMRAESRFLPSATSPVGARGLMQLMPETAAAMLREKNLDAERLYDPELNIRLGTKHLKDLLDQYKGDRIKAVAAYNAGGNNVNRWVKTYGGLAADEFVESIPFGETRDYVKKVLASSELYRRLYGME
jgi:soluble lytic murein transglycosylase